MIQTNLYNTSLQIKLPQQQNMKNQNEKQVQSLKSVSNSSSLGQTPRQKKSSLFPTILTKSRSKKLSQQKKKAQSYIQKSFQFINKGCYQNGKLNIDGEHGDHRMKLFRKKDRTNYQKNIPSLFSEDLKSALYSYALSGSQQKKIQPQVQGDRSPVSKKRGDSLNFMPNKNIPNNQQDILTIIKSIMQSNKAQEQQSNAQNQQMNKQIFKKGIERDLREQNGHLLYPNIPTYMAQKWFKVLDNSTKDGNKVTPFIQAKTQTKKKINHRKQHKYIFRFLQKENSKTKLFA